MFLQKLTLTNFKNQIDITCDFSENCNLILGENGSGKTTLIDAIYFLSLTKSSISNQEALCINHEMEYFSIRGNFVKNGKTDEVICSLQRGQRKAILIDKKAIERIADHIGNYPVVLIAPHDTDIVRDSSEARRKFFDGVISQIDYDYLQDLLLHNRLLLQRNSLLKQFAERKYFDQPLLDVYSEPLLQKAKKINLIRAKFMRNYLPIFQKHYAQLSENREKVTIFYESEVGSDGFLDDFRQNYKQDIAAHRTTKGVHKDDFIFEINDFTLRKYGSQGQQKAFAMALKLAQFEINTIEKGIKPILLMDDIFDKLDDRRIQMLLNMIENKVFGQVFITDARPERSRKLLENISGEVRNVIM